MGSGNTTHSLFLESKDNILRAIASVEKKILKHHSIESEAFEHQVKTSSTTPDMLSFAIQVKQDHYPALDILDAELPSVLYNRAFILRHIVHKLLPGGFATLDREKRDPETNYSLDLIEIMIGHINNYQLLMLKNAVTGPEEEIYTVGTIIRDQIRILDKRVSGVVDPQAGAELKLLGGKSVYQRVRDFPACKAQMLIHEQRVARGLADRKPREKS